MDVELEGQRYQFPDDASDDEIREALGHAIRTTTAAAPKSRPAASFDPNAPNLNMGFLETMGQGFSGGLRRMLKGLSGEGAESPFTGRGLDVPATNLIEGALEFANAPFIATGRVAGKTTQTGVNKLADLLTAGISDPYLAESVRQGGRETGAIAGAVADAAAQLGIPYATGLLARLLKAPFARAFPYNAERIATLKTGSEAEKAAARAKANADIQARLELLRQGRAEATTTAEGATTKAAREIEARRQLFQQGRIEALGRAEAAKLAEQTTARQMGIEAIGGEIEAKAGTQAARQEAIKGAQEATKNRALMESKFGEAAAEETLGTAGAPTAKEAGAAYISETYLPGAKASTTRFNKIYEPLVSDETPIQLTNFGKAAKKLPGEAGVMEGVLPTQAERIAEKVTAELAGTPEGQLLPGEVRKISEKMGERRNSLQISDDVYERVLNRLKGGTPGEPQTISTVGYKSPAEMFKDVLGPVENPKTIGDAVEGVLRLRAGQRAAINAKQTNIARQFGALEKPLLSDIAEASPQRAEQLAQASKAYATEHIPFYGPQAIPRNLVEKFRDDPQQVVAGIIRKRTDAHRVEAADTGLAILKEPKQRQEVIGAFFRGGLDEATQLGKGDVTSALPKWWDSYLDPKTNNHVLNKLLGERFEPTNTFMEGLKQAKTDNFSKIADEAITNILSVRDKEIKAIEAAREARVSPLVKALKEAQTARGEAATTAVKDIAKLGERTGAEITQQAALRTTAESEAAQKIAALSKQTGVEIGQIGKTKDKLISQIEKEYKAGIEKITGSPPTGNEGKFWGTVQLIHGATGAAVGSLLGFPGAGVAYGGVQILTGGMLLMAAPTMTRMLQSARGLNLLNRAARAVPGTANAISTAALIQNFVRQLPKEPEQ